MLVTSFLKVHLHYFSKIKSQEDSQNSWIQDFSYYYCMMMEGSGSRAGLVDPDPGGQKTRGSGGSGSGSGTLVPTGTHHTYTCGLSFYLIKLDPVAQQWTASNSVLELAQWILLRALRCLLRQMDQQQHATFLPSLRALNCFCAFGN